MRKSRAQFYQNQSIISRHLKRLNSPVRPLILPYHVEQVALAYASASSPEPTCQRSDSPLEIEKYFELAAQVEGMTFTSDSDF